MATIEKRTGKDGQEMYRVKVRLKGHPVQTATFERKTDAKLWAQQTEAAIREGRYFKHAESKKRTFSDVVERFKRDILPHRRSDKDKIGMHLDWWANHLGPYFLSDITPSMLAEGRDKLANEAPKRGSGQFKSPATVNRYIASLSIAFSNAVEWGWLEDNPLRKIRKMKEPRGRVRFLSDQERVALLKECKVSLSPYLYQVVILALATGARRGEILNLTWPEVDLKRRVIRLEETKNDERRAIPLAKPAYDELLALSKIRKLKCSFVFPNQAGTGPADIQDGWLLALERAKIKNFRFHDLRHTAASYLAMNGATLAEIAAILGHKTLAMVKRYTHLTEQHTAVVLERMSEQIFMKD